VVILGFWARNIVIVFRGWLLFWVKVAIGNGFLIVC
jgi:hypothetical protein